MIGSRIRSLREAAGLTQGDLALRAGVSRQLVSAVETGRHLPRVDAALALAGALGADAADLFGPEGDVVDVRSGSAPPEGSAVRSSRVGDRPVTAPARVGADGWDVADGVIEGGGVATIEAVRPGPVVAGCEPALETVERLLRQAGTGAVTVASSSAVAVEALTDGRVHAAMVHGPPLGLPDVPAEPQVVRIHMASWRVGLALPVDAPIGWVRSVRRGDLPVVQREDGAAVQRTFEDAFAGSGIPGRRVGGHVEAARCAVAMGVPAVTIEPAALAVGAGFHDLGRHVAELWIDRRWIRERVVDDMLDVLSDPGFRRRLSAIGGYELDALGTPVT